MSVTSNGLACEESAKESPHVILSAGIGRLHFVQAASALHHAGEQVELITGWIPSSHQKRVADFAGRLVGRSNLAERLAVRDCAGIIPRNKIHTCAFPEGLAAVARGVFKKNGQPWASAQRLAWQLFGRSSRRHLHSADIFQVRSGAGQGGAISRAKSLGMLVVADHSIAHPDFMAESLNPEFARYGLPAFAGHRDPFWNLVLKDCDDADVILVNSQFVSDTFQAQGIPPDRIRVSYWGVRSDFFNLKSTYALGDRIRLVFTGSFGVRKGAGYLIDALNLIDPYRKKFQLTVVGATEEFEQIRRFHSVSEYDVFIGPVLQHRLKDYLRDSDMYVFPTLTEGCAQSAMEALAAGIPVISTRECGLPVTDGEHAYLVRSHDADALAAALEHLSLDHNLREQIGRAGASLISSRFTWENYGADVRRMHEELIQGPRTGVNH